jgi:hypothetical protein
MSFFIRYCNPVGGLNYYQAEVGATATFGNAQQFATQALADAFIADHKMCATSFTNAQNNILLTTGTSFTVPNNVFTLDNIRCWGGSGGGCTGAGVNGRPGGGGGAMGQKNSLAVTPGTDETYQIGAAGANGIPGGNGTATFFRDAATVKGDFGVGGPNSDTTFGTGGLVANCVGDVKLAGGDGAARNAAQGGGGGSSAGTALAGVSAVGTTGGTAPSGGGNGGNAGAAGSAPGGGGGGGAGGSGAAGAGAIGQISFTYIIGK